MLNEADIVVVGAAIMGLSIAYQLSKRTRRSILVVDRSYLCGGASGRNGGGVRAQWSSDTNIELMQESIRMCRAFASEFKINIWFRQGGYLFIVRDEEKQRALESSVEKQVALGLRSKMLSPVEARKLVPELDIEGVVAASHNPDDGVVFPWPFVWGFAQGAEKNGVKVAPFWDVENIETRGSKIESVVLRDLRGGAQGALHKVKTQVVINAAGVWSPEIARKIGVELPNKPHRHEICSTEPLKPWLTPLVADLSDGLYFSQAMRGEIVGGIGQHYAPEGIDQNSSFDFLGRYSRSLTRACPILGQVKVLRQWAGCYDLTPDGNPILGPVDEIENFYQASGFMGHGFMMAPVIGKLLAEEILRPTGEGLFKQWNLRRYKEGKTLKGEAMIIG